MEEKKMFIEPEVATFDREELDLKVARTQPAAPSAYLPFNTNGEK
jgi:hypothetical protein